jgi:hypothetical protein
VAEFSLRALRKNQYQTNRRTNDARKPLSYGERGNVGWKRRQGLRRAITILI